MKVFNVNLGLIHFKDAWEIQRVLHNHKQKHNFPDIILSTQHYPVYTLGKTGERDHLLIDEKGLIKNKIDYHEIDRGGDITYHGPGQLVVYPIFNLVNYYKDTHRFLRDLEESVILTLAYYNIEGFKDEEFTGVWVGEEKICAMGIKVSRWITMHGLALNVNNDLAYFNSIIPCGIFHKGVTSISKLLQHEVSFDDVNLKLIENMKRVFGFETANAALEDLLRDIQNSELINR